MCLADPTLESMRNAIRFSSPDSIVLVVSNRSLLKVLNLMVVRIVLTRISCSKKKSCNCSQRGHCIAADAKTRGTACNDNRPSNMDGIVDKHIRMRDKPLTCATHCLPNDHSGGIDDSSTRPPLH